MGEPSEKAAESHLLLNFFKKNYENGSLESRFPLIDLLP
jgi:hypothetical protein